MKRDLCTNQPKASTHPANKNEMTSFEGNIRQVNNRQGVRILYDKGVASKANS